MLMGTAIARTTVTCESPGGVAAPMDCDNNGTFENTDGSGCEYNSTSQNDSTGELFNPTTGQTDPNPPDFGVNCDNAGPGETITCTAYTTDGDRDCDKTKDIPVNCAGSTPCALYGAANGQTEDQAGGDAACQASASSQICLASVCDSAGDTNGTCSGTARECCVDTPINDNVDCSAENPPLASCTNGVCGTDACLNDPDCDDGNPCTSPSTCDTGTGLCSATTDLDGQPCTTGSIPDGVCDVTVCIPVECRVAGDCPQSQCNDTACDTGVTGGNCVDTPNNANTCDTCPGVGGAPCECIGGSCIDAGLPFVCEQYSPVPLQTGKTCTGAAGDECICEKPEFIAIDCDLLGNSAPLPLQASLQQFDIAINNNPLPVLVTDAFVLPADLVCGFIDAGFTEASVANSILANTIRNANLTGLIVNDFLDDSTAGGALVSPHNTVQFLFSDACGDACTGAPGLCTSDGSACNATADCPLTGDGPGIQVPFFLRSIVPETVPPGPSPFLITPNGGAGSLTDLQVNFSGTAIELVDLTGPITTDACIGGACAVSICSPFIYNGVCNTDSTCDLANGTCDDDLSTCTSDTDCLGDGTCFGSTQTCTADGNCDVLTSPRIMYESTCSKIEFGGGACTPFDVFPDVSDVCKARGVDFADAPPCCDTGIGTGSGRPVDPSCNTNPGNRRRCCAALAENYPDSTSVQEPQLPAN
jgi:hypothetical protein